MAPTPAAGGGPHAARAGEPSPALQRKLLWRTLPGEREEEERERRHQERGGAKSLDQNMSTPPPPFCLSLSPVAALITFVTYIDRGNLSLAAPLIVPSIVTKTQYGLSASLFFVTYGFLQLPLATFFTTRAGFGRTYLVMVGLWGVFTMATAAIRGPGSLYAVRLLLGAAEAATLPGCFAFLNRFNTPAAMAVAYPVMLTFTLTSSEF